MVRGALAEALAASEATAEVAAAMRAAVHAEADENARYHMARVLAASLESFPANRTVLEELMRSERSRRIRQSVAEALAAP